MQKRSKKSLSEKTTVLQACAWVPLHTTAVCTQLFYQLNIMRSMIYRVRCSCYKTQSSALRRMRGDGRTIKKERVAGSQCGYAMPGKPACTAEVLASAAAEGRPRCRYHAARQEYVACHICPDGRVAATALVLMCSTCRQVNEKAYRKALRDYYTALARMNDQADKVVKGQAPPAQNAGLCE